MKKAKLLWLIYFGVVGIFALFFTLFINQGMGGTFSVTNKKGKIQTFNSYLFVDYNKISGDKKAKYDKLLAKYNAKSKKQVEVAKAAATLVKINKMIEVLKDRKKVEKSIKKKIKTTTKALKRYRKLARKAKGARKKRLTKRVKKLVKTLKEQRNDLAQIDVAANEAKEIATSVKKRMNNTGMSTVEALLSERTRITKMQKSYERTKAAYERDLLKLKQFIDLYRIEKIVSGIASNKVKSSGEVPEAKMNLLPNTSMEFIITAQDVKKNFPKSIGLKPIPSLNAAGIGELQNATIESITDEIKKARKKIAVALKKIRKDGSTDDLKDQLKNSREEIIALRKKLSNKKILNIIVNAYTDIIEKSVEYFKQYYHEIEKIVSSEGMPMANFVTLGIYLGKYAKGFPVFGAIVKNHIKEGKMKLKGIHRIEERLLGNRAEVRKAVSRKVFGVGEILTYRLVQTELDQFINGFKSLKNNVKYKLEQGVTFNYTTTRTTGGGGQVNLPAVNPDGGSTTNLPAVNPDGDDKKPADSGDKQSEDGEKKTEDGGDQQPADSGDKKPENADAGSGDTGALNKKEMLLTIKLSHELEEIYEALEPFFGSEKVELSAGMVNAVYKSINKLVKFMDNLKNKHKKILNQKTIDTSEEGQGMEVVISEKFNAAFEKVKKVNKYIQDNIVKLTKIKSSGSSTKNIIIVVLMLIGAVLAYLTFIWDKAEETA